MKLEISHLTKSFAADAPVLSDISFSAETSSLALIGSSGGGKSTLLRIIGGLISAETGTVTVNGRTLGHDEKALAGWRRSIGFVFQQGSLFKHMTALENVALPLREVHGVQKEEAEHRAMELLTRFGLADHALKRPAELSGGQQQRAAIVRALAPNPGLLLLDEPTSALDPEYTSEVLDVVDELRAEGVEFIIVTHEMGFARRACETTAFLYQGKILEAGLSAELFERPKTAELKKFLGRILEWNA